MDDIVADMVANKKKFKKLADMELAMVADLEVDKVATRWATWWAT